MNKQQLPAVIALAVSLAIAAGCASAPKTYPELEAARAEVRQVTSEPLAQEAAGIRLKQANEALLRADEAVRTGESREQIQQDSLLAMQNAQIAKEQVAEMKARKAVEEGEAARNQVLLDAREKDVRTAQLEADKAKQQVASANDRASDAADATARMRAELEALQAKQTDRGMVLTLGDVLFATGQATLQPGAMRVIDQLTSFLDKYPDATISVEGHTDSMGSDDYNLALSQQRADAVRSAVTAKGIDARRVTTRGLGESLPVASNTDASGRQQNRRVEIVFGNS